jgi:hypothetical protein
MWQFRPVDEEWRSRKLAAHTGTDSVHFPLTPFQRRYRKVDRSGPTLSDNPITTSDASYTGMVRSRLWLVAFAALRSVAFPAANDLNFQPIITGTKYCGEPGGPVRLRLQLELRSQAATAVPLVLPLFAKVSA